MATTSISFVFMFLPIALAIYYLVREEAREYVLLFLSIIFYACGSLKYTSLFIISIIITILLGRTIAQNIENKKWNKILLIIGIVYNVSILGYYKYYDFALSTYANVAGTVVGLKNLALPLGISFFTFKAISYLVDVYSEKVVLDASPVHDALYLSFFGQVVSGPLSRYNDMKNISITLKCKNERYDLFAEGVYRFMVGFNKKVLLADGLSNITNEIFAAPFENFSVAYAWLGAICYALQLFFDFAGYSDMAIGITKMFGYNCPENFYYPYMAESVSKFWRRWHITLGAWFRDYIYIPAGGSRVGKLRLVCNLLMVWVLTGIWHGSTWNFVFWGLGYFAVITFEKITGLPEKITSKVGQAIYRIAMLSFVICQWVIFRFDSLLNDLRFIKRMFFCEANPLADSRTLFLIKDYFVFILGAVILSFPIVPWMEKKWESNEKVFSRMQTIMMIMVAVLFIWALSFVVSGLNNPFAYANF